LILVIFEIGSCIFAWAGLDLYPCICAFYIFLYIGMTSTRHHDQPLVKMESRELFAQTGLELQSPKYLPPT
jgi:hypothetical protein